MTPLRIIMFSYERGFLDPASEASKRLERLISEEMRISVFVLSKANPQTRQLANSSIRIFNGSAFPRLCKVFFAAIKEIRAAKKRGEQVIISAQDPFIAGSMAFKLSMWLDVPYEIQEHGDFFSGYWEKEVLFFNRFLWIIGHFVLRRADGVRVVSARVKDHLVRRCGVDADRVLVNPVATDLSWHLNRAARPWPEVPTIVVPCRFVKQKGLDTLIDAFGVLARDGVRFRARLVGSGPLEPKIRDEIAKQGLADRVRIETWADQTALWGDADLFVCSSRYEGWGRTIIEAMAAGVPIVTTDVGCVGSVLRPQIDGRVVQPNDPAQLARVIKQQFEEPDRRTWLAANARERVKTMIVTPDASADAQRSSWQRIAQAENQRKSTDNSQRTTDPSRRGWIWTASLVLFATIIRLASLILFWHSLGANREWGFFTLVQNWFLGNGFSYVAAPGCASAYRSPGYLIFLVIVYGLFGFANFFAQALIQNILAVILVYLVYRLGRSISKDRRVGLVAGFLIAVHPYAFYHYTQFYHTVISGCFLVGLLLALLALERTKRWRWAIMSGIMIALLAYIQGTILPATVLLSLWLLWRWRKDWKRALGAIAVMAVVSVAIIAPWTYRNWKVFHAFVPLTTDLGYGLAKANHPLNYAMTALGYPQEAYGQTVDPNNPLVVTNAPLPEVTADLNAHGIDTTGDYFFGPSYPIEPGGRPTCADQSKMNEAAFNQFWTTTAKTWIVAHYWPDVVKLQVQKIAGFWSPVLTPGIKYGAAWSFGNTGLIATLARGGLAAYVLIVELLALIGLIVAESRKRFAYVVPILLVFAVYTGLHSFFAGYTKYRIPLDNLLVILAALALVGAWDLWRMRKRENGKGKMDGSDPAGPSSNFHFPSST